MLDMFRSSDIGKNRTWGNRWPRRMLARLAVRSCENLNSSSLNESTNLEVANFSISPSCPFLPIYNIDTFVDSSVLLHIGCAPHTNLCVMPLAVSL